MPAGISGGQLRSKCRRCEIRLVRIRKILGPEMLPLNPFCLISAGKVAGLKATIVILMVMLMKSKLLRIKMSLLGSLIGFTLLVGFLLTTGALTLVAGGAVVYAAKK